MGSDPRERREGWCEPLDGKGFAPIGEGVSTRIVRGGGCSGGFGLSGSGLRGEVEHRAQNWVGEILGLAWQRGCG